MEVRSTDVQNNFGAYLKYAQFEDVFITRNGKRVAVLRGYSKFCVAEGKPVYAEDQAKLTLEESWTLQPAAVNAMSSLTVRLSCRVHRLFSTKRSLPPLDRISGTGRRVKGVRQ